MIFFPSTDACRCTQVYFIFRSIGRYVLNTIWIFRGGTCFCNLQCRSLLKSTSVPGACLCNVKCNVASTSVAQTCSKNISHATSQLLTGTDACFHGTGSDSCQSWAADCSSSRIQLSLCWRIFSSDIRVLSTLTNTLHVWKNRCIYPKSFCIWSVVLVCMQAWRVRVKDIHCCRNYLCE